MICFEMFHGPSTTSLSVTSVWLGSWGCSDEGGSSTSLVGGDTQNDGSVDEASTPPEKTGLPLARRLAGR